MPRLTGADSSGEPDVFAPALADKLQSGIALFGKVREKPSKSSAGAALVRRRVMEAGHGGGHAGILRRGVHHSMGGASGAVLNEHAQHNKEPKPYICTAQAKDIVA